MDAYVARQPIFNPKKKIYGYELLFRNAMAKFDPSVSGDAATSTVLGNSLFNIGMDKLIGKRKSFINFTQNLLIQKVPLLLPKGETVVEILENVEPTPQLIAACEEMSRKGYIIALDDFVYKPELQPLIDIANIIKFDFRASSMDEVESYLKRLSRRDNLHLLAEKVETYEEFVQAKEMGFDYFQGYFFCKPELIQSKEISASQLSLLQVMAAVNQPDFDVAGLEKLIAPDVSISYKLLRYINSAFFAKAQNITSIQQALVYMGEMEIRRFVSLIAMSNLAKGKPDELIRASCIRAKFCERLTTAGKINETPSELFTLGMFSLIDAILDQSMAEVMKNLPLGKDIKSALVDRKGPLVGYLGLVEFYEKGLWGPMHRVAQALNIPPDTLPALYGDACRWADTFTQPE